MDNIRVICLTYVDSARATKWPTVLPALPNVGDCVQALDRKGMTMQVSRRIFTDSGVVLHLIVPNGMSIAEFNNIYG